MGQPRRWDSATAGRKSPAAIVKVTPSSKVVGDMALFLFTRSIKPADVVNLEPGSIAFPESVIDMLSGGLGEPMGGFPKDVVRGVLDSSIFIAAERGQFQSRASTSSH